MSKLAQEEREILESFEKDEWKSVPRKGGEVRRYQGYARETFKKDKRVNIRITQKDLVALQKRALQEGIPYQTLIASVLHKFVDQRLIEKKS